MINKKIKAIIFSAIAIWFIIMGTSIGKDNFLLGLYCVLTGIIIFNLTLWVDRIKLIFRGNYESLYICKSFYR